MANVVFIDAGLGGMAGAYEMRDALGAAHQVTVINERENFQFVPSNPWRAVGWRESEQISFPIRPYLEKNGLSFSVVPSRVFVGQLVGFLSVPRFWIIDANGKWQWEQVGFDVNDKEWEVELMKRLEAVVAL